MTQHNCEQFTKNILFIDIETVSCKGSYEVLPEPLQILWDKKAKALHNRSTEELDVAKSFFDQAAIYAEFGKIIVIALGFLTYNEKGEMTVRIKGLQHHNEKELLTTFKDILTESREGCHTMPLFTQPCTGGWH